MSSHVETLYAANLSVFCSVTVRPRSKTSGAVSRPSLVLAAWISSALDASWGEASLIAIFGYFFLKASMISP